MLMVAPQAMNLAQIEDRCASIEAWADECESVAELRDAGHRLEAIDEYLRRTSVDGRKRVASALRYLEERIGVLIGKANNGGDRRSDQFDREQTDLTPKERHQFRKMAEHPEIVREVIDESTDQNPPSRRKVLKRIRERRPAPNPPTAEEKSQAEETAQRQGRYLRLKAALETLATVDAEQISAEIDEFTFRVNIGPQLAPALNAIQALQAVNSERIPS